MEELESPFLSEVTELEALASRLRPLPHGRGSVQSTGNTEPRASASGLESELKSYIPTGDEMVKWYQTILKVANGESALVIDGLYGPQTKAALTRFQQRYGLGSDGKVTAAVTATLNQVALERIYRSVLANPIGREGSVLTAKVKEFQKAYKLTQDGVVGPITRGVMVKVLNGTLPSPLRYFHAVLGEGRVAPASELELETDLEEETIGQDTRTKVADMKLAPYRWICAMWAAFEDPADPSKEVIIPSGTGVLIGDRYVLTAAHIIYDDITSGTVTAAREAKRITVYPGRRDLSTPFGEGVSVDFRYRQEWKNSRDIRYDYGLIKLNKEIGLNTFGKLSGGALGWWGSAAHGEGSVIKPLAKADLAGKMVTLAGYPKEDPNTGEDISKKEPWPPQQWQASDTVHQATPTIQTQPIDQLFAHRVDATTGQSGSPLWVEDAGARNLVGIHRGACRDQDRCRPPGSVGPLFNLAVHISQDVLDQIERWKREMA